MSLNSGGHVADRVANWLSRRSKNTSIADLPELGAVIGTTIGDVRNENQDRAVIARYLASDAKDRWIALLLCDGMGGMVDGARCAEFAIGVFIGSLVRPTAADPQTRVRNALLSANSFLNKRYSGRGGSTLAGLVHSSALIAINAGDSRVYALSTADLAQISSDDSIAGELNRLNIPAQPDTDSPSFITQFVGVGDGLEPHTRIVDSKDDLTLRWILTSDGLHDPSAPLLASILRQAPNLTTGAIRLIQLSRWSGGKDNASIIAASGEIFGEAVFAGAVPGLLELWDSSSKLELLTENLAIPRSVVSDQTERASVAVNHDSPLPKSKKSRPRRPKPNPRQSEAVQSKLEIALPVEPIQVAIVDTEPPTISSNYVDTQASDRRARVEEEEKQ